MLESQRLEAERGLDDGSCPMYCLSNRTGSRPIDRLRYSDEFDYVDATLASFAFRDERLRLSQFAGQLLLDDAAILPSLF
jgi:hypothetical protein